MNILLCDDHKIVSESLKNTLCLFDDIENVYCVGNGQECLNYLKGHNKLIDVVILDIELPDMNGITVLKKIKEAYPSMKVMMLTMHDPEEFGLDAIQAGALSYMTKSVGTQELVEAIRIVSKGEEHISTSLGKLMAKSINQNNGKINHVSLTDRELSIMVLLAKAKSIHEIAKELKLNEKTIYSHKANLMSKMGFDNKSNLVDYCLKNKLL